MSSTISVIAVPNWLEEALKSHNVSLSALRNVEELQCIVSPSDVGFYIFINSVFLNGGCSPFQDCTHYFEDMANNLPLCFTEGWNTASAKFQSLDKTHAKYVVGSMLTPRMFFSDNVNEDPQSYVFQLFAIDENVYGVKLIPRNPDQTYIEHYHACCDDAIKLLRSSNSLHDIAKLNVFKEFAQTSQVIT